MNTRRIALFAIVLLIVLISAFLIFDYTNSPRPNSGDSNQPEEIELADMAIWYLDTAYPSQATLMIVNEGSTDAVITKITVRGVESSWNDIYYWKTEIGSILNQVEDSPSLALSGSSASITIQGSQRTFLQANGELNLVSHQAMILYINNPGDITPNNTTDQAIIAVYTERDLYYEATPVRAVFGGESLHITNIVFHSDPTKCVSMDVINTGAPWINIQQVTVDSVEVSNLVGDMPIIIGWGETVTITITPLDWEVDHIYAFGVLTDTAIHYKEASPPS